MLFDFASMPWSDIGSLYTVTGKLVLIFIISLALLIHFLFKGASSNVTLLNPKSPFEWSSKRAKAEFVSNANTLVRDWFHANPDKPMRLIGDVGNVTVLPPSMAQEIRNDKRLNFAKWIFNAFHGDLPGFEGFAEGTNGTNLVQTIINKDLTKLLNKVTEPLAEETALCLEALFTDSKEWHTVPLRQEVLNLVARISSRVFLGPELCRNEDWLRITRDYTVIGFTAGQELRMWPEFLRPVAHWFMPNCRKLRQQVADARRIIGGLIEQRRKAKAEAEAQGKPAPVYDDAIEWGEQEAKAKNCQYNPVGIQLSMSLASIHTTTDLISQVMTRIAQNPGILKPLREEIIEVLQNQGWKKTSLYNMKLLDSVIKESQRMKPIDIISMQRLVLEDITLSDGTIIPKNTGLNVSSHRLWDPKFYASPETWDGHRFYKLRSDPAMQTAAQLVSTSPDYLAFGHGEHACPGRFFAGNESKIALAQLVMKYDWELASEAEPQVYKHGLGLGSDPFLQIRIRRRQEEIKI